MAKQDGGSGAFVVGFMLGTVAGFTGALMKTPRAGSETLGQVRERSFELRTQASQLGSQARRQAAEQTHKVQALGGQARELAAERLHKAQQGAQAHGRIVLEQTQAKVQGAIERLEEQDASVEPAGADESV